MSTEQATHPEENLFRTLCPGMVKHTRFLLIDYRSEERRVGKECM